MIAYVASILSSVSLFILFFHSSSSSFMLMTQFVNHSKLSLALCILIIHSFMYRLQSHYEACGWDPKEGEDRYITTTRPMLISVLNTVCEDEAIKKEALRRFHLYMKNGDGTFTLVLS